jgi:hypothetical protein
MRQSRACDTFAAAISLNILSFRHPALTVPMP